MRRQELISLDSGSVGLPLDIKASNLPDNPYFVSREYLRELSSARIKEILTVNPTMETQAPTQGSALGELTESAAKWLSRDELGEKSPRRPVLREDSLLKPQPSFRSIKIWEGEVVEVTEIDFEARIFAISGPEEEEYEEFSYNELSAGERRFVCKGARFMWHIGYSTSAKGQRTNGGKLVFRSGHWTSLSLDRARKSAKEASEILGWSTDGNGTRTRRD